MHKKNSLRSNILQTFQNKMKNKNNELKKKNLKNLKININLLKNKEFTVSDSKGNIRFNNPIFTGNTITCENLRKISMNEDVETSSNASPEFKKYKLNNNNTKGKINLILINDKIEFDEEEKEEFKYNF